jgi:hypothetical protein
MANAHDVIVFLCGCNLWFCDSTLSAKQGAYQCSCCILLSYESSHFNLYVPSFFIDGINEGDVPRDASVIE